MAFTPDGEHMVTGGKDGAVQLWSGHPQLRRKPVRKVSAQVLMDLVAPDGSAYVSLSADRMLKVWGTAEEALVSTPEVPAEWGITAQALAPGGQRAALGDEQGVIRICEGAPFRVAACVTNGPGAVEQLVFGVSGTRVAALAGGTATIWDVARGELLGSWKTTNTPGLIRHPAFALSISAQENRVAVALPDRAIRVFELGKAEPVAVLRGHKQIIWEAVFSPDGHQLATSSTDGYVRLWDWAKGKIVATFHGQLLAMHGLAFSPDGTRLAAGSGEGAVKLWDLTTLQEVCTLRDNDQLVYRLHFLEGGNILAAFVGDGVHTWRASTREEIDRSLNAEATKDR